MSTPLSFKCRKRNLRFEVNNIVILYRLGGNDISPENERVMDENYQKRVNFNITSFH